MEKRAYDAANYLKNRMEKRAYDAANYLKNRKKLIARALAWQAQNRENVNDAHKTRNRRMAAGRPSVRKNALAMDPDLPLRFQ